MFAIGHPTALASPAVRGDAPVVALERDARAETTALVTSSSLEIWRGSRRLGGFWRSPATVAEEGAFLAAKWRDGRNTLAVVAEGGRVYLYHLDFHDGPETVAGVLASRCDVSRRATLRLATPRAPTRPPERAFAPRATAHALGASSAGGVPPLSPVIEDAAAANDGTCVSAAGDRDVLLVGTSTGHLVQFDWDRRDDREGSGDAASAASAASARRTGTTEKNASSGSEPAPGPGEDVRRDASAASEEVPKAPPPKGSSDPTRARTDGPGGPPDAAPDARSSPSSRVGAATTIQRLWRGFVSRVAKKKKLRAVRLIQPRARLWLRRKRARLAATRVRAFLEGIGEGSELVRRLHRLRRACATIQSAFRTAFRTHPDRVSAASARWACYERYVATRRAERAARRAGRVDNARRDALLGGFSVTRAARYEALDRREMIPDAMSTDSEVSKTGS